MRFYGLKCVFMGSYRTLIVFMDSNGFSWVLLVFYTFLLVLMGPYRS